MTDIAPRERDIAMVFQNYALYPHMTVRENLGFGLKLRKVPKAERARPRRARSAETLGLDELLDRKPASSPAASASASRWAARWCASRRPS